MLPIIYSAYLAPGLLLWLWGDRQEMTKHVPYGDVPAIMSLRAIRVISCALCLLFGTPMLLLATVEGTRERAWRKLRLARAILRINQKIKEFPEISEKWEPVRKLAWRRFWGLE